MNLNFSFKSICMYMFRVHRQNHDTMRQIVLSSGGSSLMDIAFQLFFQANVQRDSPSQSASSVFLFRVREVIPDK